VQEGVRCRRASTRPRPSSSGCSAIRCASGFSNCSKTGPSRCDLLAEIDIEPSSLSQQLSVLRRSGIVTAIRHGTTVVYALAGGDVAELMTANPTVVSTTASIRDAAKVMTSRRFRHLPVTGDAGLVGIVDITDVCRALLEADVSGPPADTAKPEQSSPH
jgi:DNA-binding transcriptional ArsR family regulator